MYYYNPLVPVKNADGSWYANTSISQSYNPLSMVYEASVQNKRENGCKEYSKATLHIIDGLDWNLDLSYQNEQYIYSNYNTTQSQLPQHLFPATVRLHAAPKENIKKQMETYVRLTMYLPTKHKSGFDGRLLLGAER